MRYAAVARQRFPHDRQDDEEVELDEVVERVLAEQRGSEREQRHEGEAQVRRSDAVTKTLTVSQAVDMAYLGQIHAIGADEIQYAKGHKYLTLV